MTSGICAEQPMADSLEHRSAMPVSENSIGKELFDAGDTESTDLINRLKSRRWTFRSPIRVATRSSLKRRPWFAEELMYVCI